MTARILVVDDVLPNVKLLEARLSAEYFEVRTAANGFDALQLCSRSPFDVILLDVMMPGMDGFEVCRRLKADPATAHVPVVLVTALDHPADRVRGLEAGADDFLTKPVDELALIARVRSLARFKQVVDELRRQVESSGTLALQPGAAASALVDDPMIATLGAGRPRSRSCTCATPPSRSSVSDRISRLPASLPSGTPATRFAATCSSVW